MAALERIEWGKLNAAHGTADQFPDWLLQLGSHDEAWRREGLQLLWANCTPPCEVTPYLIPFLIDLLEKEDIDGKDDLLGLLASCCDSRQGLNAYVDASRHAVTQYVGVITPFLASANPFEREGAIHLLSHLPDQYESCGASLRSCIQGENDPVRAARMLAHYHDLVAVIGETDPVEGHRNGQWIAGFTSADHPESVRYAAAVHCARWLGASMPAEVVDTLCGVILHPETYSRHQNDLLYRTMVDRACDALCCLPLDTLAPLLIDLLARTTDPEDAHLLAVRLLDLAFYGSPGDSLPPRPLSYTILPKDYPVERPDNSAVQFRVWQSTEAKQQSKRSRGRLYATEPKRELTTLNDAQRAALEIVCNCDLVWKLHSNLLERYGLPARRSAIPKLD